MTTLFWNALAAAIWLTAVGVWNSVVPETWPHFALLWCAGGYLAGAVVGTLAGRRRRRRWGEE